MCYITPRLDVKNCDKCIISDFGSINLWTFVLQSNEYERLQLMLITPPSNIFFLRTTGLSNNGIDFINNPMHTVQSNPCKAATLQKTENWSLRPIIT